MTTRQKKKIKAQPLVESMTQISNIEQISELSRVIEGILFASSVPMSVDAIVRTFAEEEKPKADEVKQSIIEIQARYQDRGIELVEVATGYRFQVVPQVAPYIAKHMEEKPARYSRALLETLALIAYRQPITRGEIEDIRGIVVSTHIIKTLDEHEWIRVIGHKDVPGKPALYATTKAFLDHFGLKSLDELPPLAELKDFAAIANAGDVEMPADEIKQEAIAAEQAATTHSQSEEPLADVVNEVEVESEEHAIA